jgi:HEAT repeat protein
MRRLVADTLGKIGAASAENELTRACTDPHPEVRQAALLALAQIEKDDLLELLLVAAEDGDVQVRETAVRLLADIDHPAALQATLLAAGDEMPQVRETAVRSLAHKANDEAFEALIAACSDQDYRVSKTAVESLGLFGDKALPPLAEALEAERFPDQAAVRGLEKLGGIAVPTLIAALESPRLPARRAAANALLRLYLAGSLDENYVKMIDEQKITLAAYAHQDLLDGMK